MLSCMSLSVSGRQRYHSTGKSYMFCFPKVGPDDHPVVARAIRLVDTHMGSQHRPQAFAVNLQWLALAEAQTEGDLGGV